MSHDNWLELVYLAELHCPQLLMDLPVLMEADARDALLWLRRQVATKEGRV